MSIELGNARLLQLADILDIADEGHIERQEPTYRQNIFAHACGTPSCALGHWAATNTDRWHFGQRDEFPELYLKSDPYLPLYKAAQNEFCLSSGEEAQLFGCNGCRHATTAKQAAKYIREFVAKRQS